MARYIGIIIMIFLPKICFADAKSLLESTLISIFDYDSRTYLAMAREKEAKRRARFEAVRQRLMEEDRELALAGSRISLSILRIGCNFLLMLIQDTAAGNFFKNNTPLGNLGITFLMGWLSYYSYQWFKQWRYSSAKPEVHKHFLIDNCQSNSKIYTKYNLHQKK